MFSFHNFITQELHLDIRCILCCFVKSESYGSSMNFLHLNVQFSIHQILDKCSFYSVCDWHFLRKLLTVIVCFILGSLSCFICSCLYFHPIFLYDNLYITSSNLVFWKLLFCSFRFRLLLPSGICSIIQKTSFCSISCSVSSVPPATAMKISVLPVLEDDFIKSLDNFV